MTGTVDLGELRVRCEVRGNERAPAVLLCHSLGLDLSLWDAQVDELSRSFRVVRYDVRGQGGTTVTPGPYTIEQLARDALALLDALAIPRAHFCGVSLGGAIGQWLGARAADRVDRLVLSNTAAWFGPPAGWNTRIELVRRNGMSAVEPTLLERWFTPELIACEPDLIARIRQVIRANSIEGYTACCTAVRDADNRELASEIRQPVLVVAGRDDRVTSPDDAAWLAGHIPHARLLTLAGAHLVNIESAREYTAAVVAFLSSPEA